MYTGPIEAGTTIVTSVALAAARTVVEQQAQYNETIQQKKAERKVEYAKDSSAGSAGSAGSNDTAKKPESPSQSASGDGGLGQAGFTGDSSQSQSTDTSRGSQVDLQI